MQGQFFSQLGARLGARLDAMVTLDYWRAYLDPRTREGPLHIGWLISLLFVIFLLTLLQWLVVIPQDHNQRGSTGPISVSLAPHVQAGQTATVEAEAPPNPVPRAHKSPAPAPSAQAAPVTRAPAITSSAPSSLPPLPPPVAQPASPAQDDMMAFVKRRQSERDREDADERIQEARESSTANGDARRNKIIAANVAAGSGSEKNGNGGVFTVTPIGPHDAQLTFNGWNPTFRHEAPVLYEVRQGSEESLELAIVKQEIVVIRQRFTGDFIWNSHRLNRPVPQSARIEDTDDLINFLLLEHRYDFGPRTRAR